MEFSRRILGGVQFKGIINQIDDWNDHRFKELLSLRFMAVPVI